MIHQNKHGGFSAFIPYLMKQTAAGRAERIGNHARLKVVTHVH